MRLPAFVFTCTLPHQIVRAVQTPLPFPTLNKIKYTQLINLKHYYNEFSSIILFISHIKYLFIFYLSYILFMLLGFNSIPYMLYYIDLTINETPQTDRSNNQMAWQIFRGDRIRGGLVAYRWSSVTNFVSRPGWTDPRVLSLGSQFNRALILFGEWMNIRDGFEKWWPRSQSFLI